jgi:hypothetical protein
VRVPEPPTVTPLPHVSPSLYEALLRCKARAAWIAKDKKSGVPEHPNAILGACQHSVIEDAHRGRLAGLEVEACMVKARELFDRCARFRYDRGHPLLRAKFTSPDKLPYYNLFRERATQEAKVTAARVGRTQSPMLSASTAAQVRHHAEKRLISTDGLLVGRPDFIDLDSEEVFDYKTGAIPQETAGMISEAEARQLRLYVHLALENGMRVTRALIVRADGRRASIDVSTEEANAEGRRAREQLAAFNNSTDKPFSELANPSPENCTFCPCVPFCDAFWQAAQPVWSETCGIHLEGRVTAVETSTVQGVKLLTLRVENQRGTVPSGPAFVERIPESWTTADGSAPPQEGDLVRVVHGHLANLAAVPVVRVDRTATTVWTVPPN